MLNAFPSDLLSVHQEWDSRIFGLLLNKLMIIRIVKKIKLFRLCTSSRNRIMLVIVIVIVIVLVILLCLVFPLNNL